MRGCVVATLQVGSMKLSPTHKTLGFLRFSPAKLWLKDLIKMKPSRNGSLILDAYFGLREGRLSSFSLPVCLSSSASQPPPPGLTLMASLDSRNIFKHPSIWNQINSQWGQPWKAQKLRCIYTVTQHTLTMPTWSFCEREGSTTLEQIPIVSFAFTSPASRSFPTGSNILLAMFNSPAPGGLWVPNDFSCSGITFRSVLSFCPCLSPGSLLGPPCHL